MPKFIEDKSRCIFTACPTGETFAGPCQAVLTPNISQVAAILRAGLKPPMAEIWQRMKSIQWLATNGSHSLRLTNNSPSPRALLSAPASLETTLRLLGQAHPPGR